VRWGRRPAAPARLVEALRHLDATGARAGEVPVACRDPIFVLAAGWRSGSTLVQRLIVSDPTVLVWGEPFGDHAPIRRLAGMLEPFADADAHAEHAIERRGGDLSGQWIANLNPGVAALRRAHLAWFEGLFAEPAHSRGYRRWGGKWVRLDAGHAHYLRWLYPECRLVFLVRHPLDAWRSYRAQGSDWYLERPDRQVRTARAFLAHWARLAASFAAEHEELGALLLRYEDLVGDGGAAKELADHVGCRIDPDVLRARIGASGGRRRDPRAARWLCAMRYREVMSSLGYRVSRRP
jgi:hypothetical protein